MTRHELSLPKRREVARRVARCHAAQSLKCYPVKKGRVFALAAHDTGTGGVRRQHPFDGECERQFIETRICYVNPIV